MAPRATLESDKKGKRDKREELLRTGVEIFTEKGFHNTPLDELVAAAGVPKGSFAYYFGSKDAYTLAVIELYAEYFNKKLDRILCNQALDPLDRVEAFLNEATEGMKRFEFRRGCLVGNLGQELGALNENFRQALLATMRGWQRRLHQCLLEAQQRGDIDNHIEVEGLSSFFWYAWEGAVLGAKLEKSQLPLDLVRKTFLDYLGAMRRTSKDG